jgi:RNA polymerase sporulation-specific sigma factor
MDKGYDDFKNEKMVKMGLSILSEREKEIIYKRYFNNLTQIEIAEELNISQAQVSRIEKNALKSMHNKLK